MSYVDDVLYFWPYVYIYDALMVYIAYLFAGKRMPYRKVFALQIPVALIQSMADSVWMLADESPNLLIHYFWEVFSDIYEIVILVSWVYFLFRASDKKKMFFYVSTVYPILVLIVFGISALKGTLLLESEASFDEYVWTATDLFQSIALDLPVYVGVAAIIWLVSKTNFWNKLQAFVNYTKLYLLMGIFYFLFYAVFGAFSMPLFILVLTILYLLLFGLVVFLVSDLKSAEALNAARNLLLQQQNYINKLESIQQELRSIQHDYKNMLSGLYAQAREGNVKAVKEYIDTKLLKVDEAVKEDLRQMNQLARIELPELKGLILTKILEAERDYVLFHLEVKYPVYRTSMATEDLLRCMGILLDNAIEEARTQKGATVTLLLLQEGETLTVVVKNPVQDKPDLTLIRDGGYSTKGFGRGIGLSNYRNIIRKYPNALHETKIERENFIQVLVL